MAASELERIRALSALFAPKSGPDPRVLVGIGDDAAVLAPCDEPLVWTVDASVEGVHFRREWLHFEDIGYRSMMAAVSDLAAMSAEPLGVLSALVLPDDVTDDDLHALARGQRDAAHDAGTIVIGGNLARGGELSITTTALGRAPHPSRRAGARPGDTLWLIGPVGLAAAGLRLLMKGSRTPSKEADLCVAAWRRPRARIAEGLTLRGVATAAVDISDGLARDVGHLARASEVCAVIDASAFELALDSPSNSPDPLHLADLHAAASMLGEPAIDLASFGGEDYAIAFTAPGSAKISGAVAIGRIEPVTNGAPPGVMIERANGHRDVIDARGFDHFARREGA